MPTGISESLATVYCIVSVHTSRYTMCMSVYAGEEETECSMRLYSISSVGLYGSGPPRISPPGCEIAPSRENDINMHLSLPTLILEPHCSFRKTSQAIMKGSATDEMLEPLTGA